MRLPFSIALLLACWTPIATRAQNNPGSASTAPATLAPSPSVRLIRSALGSLASNDAAAALHILEEAADADPDNAMVFCLMGDAQRLGGRGPEAVQSYQNAMRLAGQDARIEARARIGIARTLEMDPAKWADAREAWIAYVRFADTHADVASSEVGRARVQAIDLVMELEAAYPEVRQRIAARAAAQQATR